jgi:hypothetical protein
MNGEQVVASRSSPKETEKNNETLDKISGSQGSKYEEDCLLGCCAV